MKLLKKLFKTGENDTHKIYHILGIRIKIRKKPVPNYLTPQTLAKILNNVMDITRCPKARGKLRKLQIADTLLLKIFHNICVKHNMQYWLADGTLLGAIRHNGFIPWDDDLDVCISYDSYDKMVSVLQSEFNNTNFKLYGIDKTRFGNATIRITHQNFEFLNLDIFYCHPSSLPTEDRAYVQQIKEQYKRLYYRRFSHILREDKETLKNFRLELNVPFEKAIKSVELSEASTLVRQISSSFTFVDKSVVFPLKSHKFEEFEFYVPNDTHKALTECFGNYLSFPDNFIQHQDSMFQNFEEAAIDPIIDELKQFIEQQTI